MKRFDTRPYSVADFIEWTANGLLNLSPDFQRRSVWKESARSYLIDTLLRGRPIPKILITQHLKAGKTVRVVVDGQQRLRAILDYVSDSFKISKAHNPEFPVVYSKLPEEMQDALRTYEISCDLLYGAEYEEILDIFTRLNAYTVPLTQQEKLNAEYVGYFKQTSYKIGYKYVKYWLDSGVLSQDRIARMGEAELASDLTIAMLFGVQTSKSIPTYYKRFEDNDTALKNAEVRFDRVMSIVGAIYPVAELKASIWKKGPLFYTLFGIVAHSQYGVAGVISDRPKINEKALAKTRQRLDEIGALLDRSPTTLNRDQLKFVDASKRRTADTKSRAFRIAYACKELIK
ncbi:MAG: DUF262 domain-containing protein [Proteobacteria bacterium]|nr:DUF262 domain-containing protein [Pseudomonadota bacterium]